MTSPILILSLALAGAPEASSTPAATSVAKKKEAPAPKGEFNSVGLSLDAGVPDFAGVNLSIRPMGWYWLRLEGGVVTNSVNNGVRAGVTLMPFHWGMRLTFTGEVGRMFAANAGTLLGQGDPTLSTLLSSVSYDFANAHAGLEFGTKNFGFFLRGGLSYIDVKFDKAIDAIPSEAGEFSGGPVHLRATLPTVKLGLNFYFI